MRSILSFQLKPNLCIGTAQFGQSYGVTNQEGKVAEDEVKKILAIAMNKGIAWLDTAQAYGNAEYVLGRQLPRENFFRFVGKFPSQKCLQFCKEDVDSWEKAFQASCRDLGIRQFDTYLLHSTADLRKPGCKYLEDWLLSLRNRGLVRRLGVSIYDSSEISSFDSQLLDVVQLPLSLLDQRSIEDGTISRLQDNGIAIHLRSIYMQGLLLTPPEQWPEWISAEARAHQRKLVELASKKNCDLIDLALGFIKQQISAEAVVVGVCKSDQLVELLSSWYKESPWQECEWKAWSLQDERVLDPRKWPI